MAEQEAAFCPNCNKPAIRQGKVITCEPCDMSFRYTQEGPRLHEIGPLENRIQALEEKIGITQPDPLTPDSFDGPAEPAEDEEENGI